MLNLDNVKVESLGFGFDGTLRDAPIRIAAIKPLVIGPLPKDTLTRSLRTCLPALPEYDGTKDALLATFLVSHLCQTMPGLSGLGCDV
jgi:hypothetical protein